MYEHPRFAAGDTGAYLRAEISAAFDELREQKAIRLEQVGESELEALVATAYSKLGDLIFQPATTGPSALHRASELLGERGDAAVFAYEMKSGRQHGEYRVDLDKRVADQIALRFEQNLGDLFRDLDAQAFSPLIFDEPTFMQRQVSVFLPGTNVDDFDDLLKVVSVELRKLHPGGRQTLQEAIVDHTSFSQPAARGIELMYGWDGDESPQAWRAFEYRVRWALQNGAPIVEDWQQTSLDAISLRPPFERQSIQLEARRREALAEAGVAPRVREADERGERSTAHTDRRPRRRARRSVEARGSDRSARQLGVSLPDGMAVERRRAAVDPRAEHAAADPLRRRAARARRATR